jgi:CRISPR-associated protein Cas2
MNVRNFYLISYDIPNDKRRLKIAHLLEGYGARVQYSVFEVWATEEELDKLRERLTPLVEVKAKPNEDAPEAAEDTDAGNAAEADKRGSGRDGDNGGSVRIYRLCATCQGRREILGEGDLTEAPDLYIF